MRAVLKVVVPSIGIGLILTHGTDRHISKWILHLLRVEIRLRLIHGLHILAKTNLWRTKLLKVLRSRTLRLILDIELRWEIRV